MQLILDNWQLIGAILSLTAGLIIAWMRLEAKMAQLESIMEEHLKDHKELEKIVEARSDHGKRISTLEKKDESNTILLVSIQKEMVAINTKLDIYFGDHNSSNQRR